MVLNFLPLSCKGVFWDALKFGMKDDWFAYKRLNDGG